MTMATDPKSPLCPWCGAYSPRSCELEDEMGLCPWDESDPDPDILREDATERARLTMEDPDDEFI